MAHIRLIGSSEVQQRVSYGTQLIARGTYEQGHFGDAQLDELAEAFREFAAAMHEDVKVD